jgi:hypothetical protein
MDRASWYICVIKTNKMHFSLLIYFNNHPLHVSNRITIHLQEVFYCICIHLCMYVHIYIYMCQFKYLALTWYVSTIHDIMTKIYTRVILLEWWKYTTNWVRKREQPADETEVDSMYELPLGRLHISYPHEYMTKSVQFFITMPTLLCNFIAFPVLTFKNRASYI